MKKDTAIEWLEKILEGQKKEPFDYFEWKIAFDYAKEIEKKHIKEVYLKGLENHDLTYK